MHESDRRLLSILYCIFHPIYRYLGVQYVYRKAVPTQKEQFPTLLLWVTGIYIALFGLASQRYENRVDIIERKVSSIYARLTPITSAIIQLPPIVVEFGDSGTVFIHSLSEYEELKRLNPSTRVSISEEESKALAQRDELVIAKKEVISKIPDIQNYPCPVVPSIFKLHKTILSLFVNTVHKESVEELRELIVDAKKDLKGTHLYCANLERANLEFANLEGAYLEGANLKNANIPGANLKNANLSVVELEGAYLSNANLNGADLTWAKLEGANLQGTNLKKVKELNVWQLSRVTTLYKAKLDPELMEQVKERYPHLLEKPKEEYLE